MQNGRYKDTLLGTPQGGIISPLLLNIYLFEFDQWIYRKYIEPTLTLTKAKKLHKENRALREKQSQIVKKLKNEALDKSTRLTLRNELKQLAKISKKLPTYELSSLPKKAVFTRYAHNWVLCISGTKEDAIRIKTEIEEYVANVLLTKLSPEKTSITHIQDGFVFLGYSIKMNTPEQDKVTQVVRKYKNKVVRTRKLVSSRKITIGIDMNRVMFQFLNTEKYITRQPNFKTGFKPIAVKRLKRFSDYEIVLKFHQKFMGFYMYYRHCDKRSGIHFASYVMQYSCAATLAARHNRSIKATFEKYGNSLTVRETFFLKDKQKKEKEIKFSTYAEMLIEHPPDPKPYLFYKRRQDSITHGKYDDPYPIKKSSN
jgi:hypothetical protein